MRPRPVAPIRPAAIDLNRASPRVTGIPALCASRTPRLPGPSRGGEGHREAEDSQSQMQEVIEDGVAVGDQPEHHGHQEPQDADHEVYDPQCQYYAAGR